MNLYLDPLVKTKLSHYSTEFQKEAKQSVKVSKGVRIFFKITCQEFQERLEN